MTITTLPNIVPQLWYAEIRRQAKMHALWMGTNYGNSMFPIDKLFNSWHDGSEQGMKTLRTRGKKN